MTAIASKLPFEILSSIFILCAQEDPTRHPTVVKPPLLPGRVCSQWRQIAHETQQLWTKIFIKCCNDMKRFDLRAARTYLSYYDYTLPLTLYVHWGVIDPKIEEDWGSFEDLVVSHSERWSKIAFRLYIRTSDVLRVAQMIQGFKLLTGLQFTLPATCTDVPKTHGDKRFYYNWRINEQSSAKTISLPSIRHLELNFEDNPDPTATLVPVVETLTLPSLASLTILLPRAFPSQSTDSHTCAFGLLGKMLARSGLPPVRSITTSHNSTFHARYYLSYFLLRVPQLKRAHHLYFDHVFWGHLAETLPSSNPNDSGKSFKYVPNLQEIYFRDLADYVAKEVIQMLSERWNGGKGPLKRVVLVGEEKCLEIYEALAQSQLIGLKFETRILQQ